jgi:molybdenum cofactor cytidylyltransferase
MTEVITKYGIVILAAGESSRLGSPKQLLAFQHKTLLRLAAETALDAACGPVVVVTGANHFKVEGVVHDLHVHVVYNAGWSEGMASSLRTGLASMLEKFPDTDVIIFMVCDQPFVTKRHLLCLIGQQQKNRKTITASGYAGKVGTPALFHKHIFAELMALKGDKGARLLITQYPEQTEVVHFEEGAIDIDTKEDYERLLNEKRP